MYTYLKKKKTDNYQVPVGVTKWVGSRSRDYSLFYYNIILKTQPKLSRQRRNKKSIWILLYRVPPSDISTTLSTKLIQQGRILTSKQVFIMGRYYLSACLCAFGREYGLGSNRNKRWNDGQGNDFPRWKLRPRADR